MGVRKGEAGEGSQVEGGRGGRSGGGRQGREARGGLGAPVMRKVYIYCFLPGQPACTLLCCVMSRKQHTFRTAGIFGAAKVST